MPQSKTHFLKLIGQPPGERGRATKYNPDLHCQLVRDLAERGEFQEAWASSIGVTMATMRVWVQQHEEFREACIIAHQLLVTYWTRQIASNVTNPDAKAAMFAMMVRRFPAIYGKDPIDLQTWLMEPAQEDAPEGAMTIEQIRAAPTEEIKARLEELRRRREEERRGI